ARQALRTDRALLGAGPGLEDVEEAEPDGLLDGRVAVDLDVGALPEPVEVLALVEDEGVPPRVPGTREGRGHLVAQRVRGPGRGPPVADVLDDAQRLAGLEDRDDGRAGPVLPDLDLGLVLRRGLDVAVHRGRDRQVALPAPV